MSNLEELKQVFNDNKDKRICVLGTTCTGKTTLIEKSNFGVDMDEEIFPLLTPEETEYVCRTPWTEEIGNKMDELVRTKLKIKPGIPMFGTVLLDCDLIVYLHISDELLLERTTSRNVDFNNAKNMQQKIEEEIKKSNISAIYIEVQNEKKKVL
jgi:dephospho-CoA kinase